MSRRQTSETRVVSAPAAEIFELLADPSMHPIIDGSRPVIAARGSQRRPTRSPAATGRNRAAITRSPDRLAELYAA